MLQEIITDKNFAWDKSTSSNLANFIVKISNNAINELKDTIKNGNVETIKNKTKDLAEASMKLGEAIYKSQQEQAKPEAKPEANESTSGGEKENVVDADFEEVSDKK